MAAAKLHQAPAPGGTGQFAPVADRDDVVFRAVQDEDCSTVGLQGLTVVEDITRQKSGKEHLPCKGTDGGEW